MSTPNPTPTPNPANKHNVDVHAMEQQVAQTAIAAEKRAKKELGEFRNFILRGNVVDLAVGIIVGAAFTGVVTALVKDLITPLIGLFGNYNLPGLAVTWRHSTFQVGDFLNTIISFLIISLVVYYFVVKPVNALMRFYKQGVTVHLTRECPYCKNEISVTATRCGHCTSHLSPVDAAHALEDPTVGMTITRPETPGR